MKLEQILMADRLSRGLDTSSFEHESGHRKEDDTTTSSSSDGNGNDPVVERLLQERQELSERCQQLETLIMVTRRENDIWKVKMTMVMGDMSSKLDSLREDKSCLEEKCKHLGKQLLTMQLAYAEKLKSISDLEDALKTRQS